MHILMVIKRFHPRTLFGGAEKSACRLARELRGRGVEIELMGARLKKEWRAEESLETEEGKIRIRRLFHPSLRMAGTLVFNLLLFLHILRRRKRYHLIHVHFAGCEMISAVLARLLGGPPVICKVACAGEAGEIALGRSRFYSSLFLYCLRRVDRFAVLSPVIEEELARSGVAAEKLIPLPNGVDTDIYRIPTPEEKRAARESARIPPGSRALLFTGRLSRQKGLDILLQALSTLKDLPWVLLLAGQGREKESLLNLAETLGLSGRVRFLGPVDDVLALYRAADIFVLPSREEGLSNSLLEAMSCGLPVVATRISGSAQLVADGVSGILVPPGDPSGLASALERILAGRGNLGKEARRRIREGYTIGSTVDRYLELYHELSGPPSRSGGGGDSVPGSGDHLRILTLINSYPPRLGGAERLAEALAAEFIRQGNSNLIITRRVENSPWLDRRPGITVYRLPVFGPRMLRSLLFRAGCLLLLLLLRRRYDCIHAHSLDSPAFIAVWAKRFLGKPVFVTIHNIGKVEGLRERFSGGKKFRKIIGGCDKIISINRQIRAELLAEGCPAETIVFLPNGVDTEFYAPLPGDKKSYALVRMGIQDRVICLFVGNFHNQKGIDILLRAWRLFKDQSSADTSLLYLIGDGVLLNDLRSLAGRLGIEDTVRFLGRRADVHHYLKLADIFIQPSRWEGLSIALLEALSCARAVITTPVGGNVEVITDGFNGLFTPVDDI
ncbi:MAG: glycosyltransferase, partial [Candidatus Krumholzibacteriota bacterium]|nr:glycosyltransferase [Candidatus Krumholzibacteriota bacterium]